MPDKKVFASIFLDKSSWYANIKMLHTIASKDNFGKHNRTALDANYEF